MRIIARNTIVEFYTKHPETKTALEHWYQVAKAAEWNTSDEVISSFPKAKTIPNHRVRFEIKGGDYRMIVAFDYTRGIGFIKFIGSHADYDKIDAATVSLF
jgi:mRNA interferase HigB